MTTSDDTISRYLTRYADSLTAFDAETAAGKSRGPLHGVPIAVKDLCNTAGVATAAGMAKQLGLGKLLADGAAINRYKQPCALTALMNLPRQQFLAGAHIALNQHCKTGRCQFLQLVKQVFGTRVEKHQRPRTNA